MAQAIGDGGAGSSGSSTSSNLNTGIQGASLAMKLLSKEKNDNAMVRRMNRPVKTPEEALNEALRASGGK